MDAFADLVPSLSEAVPPPPSSRDPSRAPVPPAAPADVRAMTAGQLKRFLDSVGVDHHACVEKSELLALALARVEPAAPSNGAGQWVGRGAAPVTAIERGLAALGNAFDASGFGELARSAATSADHELAYRAAAVSGAGIVSSASVAGGTAGSSSSGGGMSDFLAALTRIPLAHLAVPCLPSHELAVRVPAVATAPVLQEVPWSTLRDYVTELPPAVAAAAAAATPTAIPHPLLPHVGQASLIGPRRLFEAHLRPDASVTEVLAAIAACGRSSGLELIPLTTPSPYKTSLVMGQRVTVPSSAWTAFLSSPSVVPPPSTLATSTGTSPPHTVIYPGAGGAAGGISASGGGVIGSMQALMGSRTAYVNTISALVGTNATGERVLLLVCARFVPPSSGVGSVPLLPTAAAAAANATAGVDGAAKREAWGVAVSKDRVGGKAVVVGSTSTTTTPAVSSLLSDLDAAGSGVVCALVLPRKQLRTSYRADRRGGEGSGIITPEEVSGSNGIAAVAASPQSALDDDDPFGLTPSSAPATAATPSLKSHPAARALLLAPGLHAKIRMAHERAPGCVSSAATADINEECDINTLLPGFEDGSHLTTAHAIDANMEWSALRVAFLHADLRAPSAAGTAAAAKASAAASASASSFALSDVEDELVQLAGALTSSLRGSSILAEAAWADALHASRCSLAAQRGENIAPPPPPPTRRFIVSPDAVSSVAAGWKARGEALLFSAVGPYEAAARAHEACGTLLMRAFSPAAAAASGSGGSGATLLSPPAIPELMALPLECDDPPAPTGPGADALTHMPPFSGSAPPPLFPPTPAGLTATNEALRAIYACAYATVRRLSFAAAVESAVSEYEADVEMRARFHRKVTHVGLRCAAAFYGAAAAVTKILEAPAPAASAKPDPARTLVANTFSLPHETALLYSSASALKLLGEAALTPSRLLFHANVLSFHTRRNIPLDAIVGVQPTHTGLGLGDNTLSVSYVDDALSKSNAAARAKAAASKEKASSAATLSAAAAAPSSSAVLGEELAPAPPVVSAQSIDDAFGDLCELDTAPPPPVVAAAAIVAAATTKSSTAAPAGVATSSPVSSLPLLSPDDAMSFLAAGGTAADVVTLHVTPMGGDSSARDAWYAALQLVRQLEARRHVNFFDFTLPAASAAVGDLKSLPGVSVPDLHSWLKARADASGALPPPPKPAILCGSMMRAVPETGISAASAADVFGGIFSGITVAATLPASSVTMTAAAPAPAAPAPPLAPAAGYGADLNIYDDMM